MKIHRCPRCSRDDVYVMVKGVTIDRLRCRNKDCENTWMVAARGPKRRQR